MRLRALLDFTCFLAARRSERTRAFSVYWSRLELYLNFFSSGASTFSSSLLSFFSSFRIFRGCFPCWSDELAPDDSGLRDLLRLRSGVRLPDADDVDDEDDESVLEESVDDMASSL